MRWASWERLELLDSWRQRSGTRIGFRLLFGTRRYALVLFRSEPADLPNQCAPLTPPTGVVEPVEAPGGHTRVR